MSDVEPVEPEPVAVEPKRSTRKVIAIVAAVVVLAGIAFAVTRKDSGPSQNDAVRVCEVTVRDKLKSPSTAVFEADKPPKINTSSGDKATPGAVVVQGMVDSQNGFGATVRSTYFCIAKVVDGKFTAAADDVILI